MRLIDADALAERTEVLEDFFVTNWTTEKVQRLIHEAPTIDAVPVVRCKDCKHWNNACCGLGTGDCHVLERLTFETFFCSYGERRSDD